MKKSARKKSTKKIAHELLGYKKAYRETVIVPLSKASKKTAAQLYANMPGFMGASLVWHTKKAAKDYYKKCGHKCPGLELIYTKIVGLK